jgi:hypothetical protein
VNKVRVLPLPHGIPEPPPLRALRQFAGLPEVYIEVTDEVVIRPTGGNFEMGLPPKVVLDFDLEQQGHVTY